MCEYRQFDFHSSSIVITNRPSVANFVNEWTMENFNFNQNFNRNNIVLIGILSESWLGVSKTVQNDDPILK